MITEAQLKADKQRSPLAATVSACGLWSRLRGFLHRG